MKTTIDIPDDELKEAVQHTGARTKRLEQLAEQLGTFDDVVSREELLRLRGELQPQPR